MSSLLTKKRNVESPHDRRHEETQGSSPEGRESAVQLGLAESHGSRRPLIPLL